jgi:low density lipoprotein-related protein 2
MYWLDEGGSGVPSKLAKANMDGTESQILVRDLIKPQALGFDYEKKVLYFSSDSRIESIGADGRNRVQILQEPSSSPKSLLLFESRLYYLDNVYEKITRVDLNGENPKSILSNEPELKYMRVSRKRGGSTHVCQNGNGGCEHLCVPGRERARVCKCSIGYRLRGETGCSPFKSFLLLAQSEGIRGFSVESGGGEEAIIPISGSDHAILSLAVHVLYNYIYWVDFSRPRSNGIFRVRPNGTELEHVISTGIGSNGIRGIAIDYSSNQLYFTNVFSQGQFSHGSWFRNECFCIGVMRWALLAGVFKFSYIICIR